ncbi:MAG: 50S ribosomal protein L25 [Myxococcota bacterium]
MTTTLQAEVREERGKGPARRLRAQGMLPAVFYGPGVEPTALTVSPKDLEKALRGDFGRNTLFTLSFAGKEELAMVRELVVDPVSRAPVHVDFYRVSVDREIVVEVPFTTHGRAVGVVKGGKLTVTRRTVPVRTTPDKIPALIDVDVTNVDMFETVQAKDVTMPEGTSIALKPALTLVNVGEDKRAIREAERKAKEEAREATAAPS